MKAIIQQYYSLAKPGVLYGNVITGVAGFLLAAGYFKSFNWVLFGATIIGMTLVIASACVLNNVLDRDIDRLMERTKQRAVANGAIAVRPALTLAVILGLLGFASLIIWTNSLVVEIGIVGYVVYVWLYGALSKRKSIHGTLVGSISGAMPILAGYCAVSGQIDPAAVLLFLMLFFWQFPEFYSIAIYRRKEYAAAGVPVMPVVKGVEFTKILIFIFTVLFIIISLFMTLLDYTHLIYFVIMAVLDLNWLKLALRGLERGIDNDAWARRMFHFSLIILIALSVLLSVGSILP
ncbi:MAG: heme o synthase [Candidatus Saccharimonadales bacterium]